MAMVYALADPATLEIRYVGKTTVSLHKRLLQHIERARTGLKQRRLFSWLRSIQFAPTAFALEVDPSDLDAAEVRWIAELREAGFNLCNMTNGGDGGPGYRHTPETIEHLRETSTGRKRSVDSIERTRQAHLGVKRSEETRQKLIAAAFRTVHTIKICGKRHAWCAECRVS